MAARVELLLRENLAHLGKCGDLVKVAPGYARNYLLPRKLAVHATEDNKKLMTRRRAKLDVEDARRAEETNARVEVLAGVVLKTSGKADEAGQLYGSVNAAQVAALLQAAGHAIVEKDVRLDAPLKTVGSHLVRVHVHGDSFAAVKVEVEAAAS